MKESYEFTDMSSEGNGDSRTNLTEGNRDSRSKGCHISVAMGFMLALVAILIAVGVGIIVHFAAPAKTLQCHCNCPVPDISNPTPEAQWQACKDMAQDRDYCMVPGCPGGSPAPDTTPVTTVTTAMTTTPTTPKPSTNFTDMRIPRALNPLNYRIELEPKMYEGDKKDFTFHGSVKILMQCLEATSNITLHIKNLEISNSSISLSAQDGGNAPTVQSYDLDPVREFIVFNLASELTSGKQYTIEMEYDGPLKDDLHGLYLSSYKQGNDTVYLATSQLQTTDARKTFPCFDEPGIKATFDVTLVRRSDYSSVSNMPRIQEDQRGGNMVADVYNTTAKMSTYLLAFLVSKFASNKEKTPRNIEVGVWTPPNTISQADYALRLGVDILDYFEKYYEIDYPLPKLDMAAIPDFAFGGMENWGLIMYRETALLYVPGVSSALNQIRVAQVVAHELAHQWFGNLVTPSWWDDLWLNEGFASYMEHVGMNHAHPEWKIMERFVVTQLQYAFQLDGLKSSHPIYAPVNHPDEINEIFDAIAYNKGASMLRMLRNYLGESTFQLGVKNYLEEHRFGSATHDDLWRALDNAAASGASTNRVTIKDIMDTWILQMNYPVVNVTRSRSHVFKVTQSRFVMNSDAPENPKYPSPYNYKWEIPFTYTSSLQKDFTTSPKYLMRRTDPEKEIENSTVIPDWSDKDAWVIGNARQTGYYRVNYDRDNWNALIRQLKNDHKVIVTENRAQLINDAFSLARAGLTDPRIALNTLEYLENEQGYVPWKAAVTEITYINSMLSRSGAMGDFKNYMKTLLTKPYNRVGWETDGLNALEALAQSLIVGYSCSYDVPGCATEAKKLYAEWMANPEENPVPAELKSSVYCTAIAKGGAEEWEFAYDMYTKTDVASERDTLQASLACTGQTWLLSRYLEYCLDTTKVRKQDAISAISAIAASSQGRSLAWDFVRDNWDEFKDRYKDGVFQMARLIRGITNGFNTKFDLEQLKEFVEKNPDFGSGQAAVGQAMEKVEANIGWMETMEPIIVDWLAETKTPEKITDIRLPTALTPMEYDVELKPDFYGPDPANFSFDGSVKIRMRCVNGTQNITLHVNKLDIDEPSIQVWTGSADASSGTPIGFQSPLEDKDRQFFILPLNTALTPGQEYYISMKFTGPLRDDLTGLYLSQYKRGNTTVYMATSQMQPTDARKAFPCFDEPAIKAEFNIILVRKARLISLSNMPISRTDSRADGFEADVYEKSEKMSTYLLAFIVCDFKFKQLNTSRGTPYRAYAREEALDQVDYALDLGVKVIDYFEEYFNIPFPLPKIDMIAIPDFGAGAMENWGLITYRETAMLYDPKMSSEGDKEWVAIVVSHELAHSWFGNLVTPSWWDDLWLNEGFATFVEYIGVDHVHKDWKTHEKFVRDALYGGFRLDGLVTSHPLYVPVGHPDEINAIFDSISYSKGAAVINLIKQFLGEQTFSKGLQKYLKEQSYGAAFHDDLWKALTQQSAADGSNINVKEVMDTWILQMNYPVITFNRSSTSNTITVSQERYLQDPEAKDPGKYVSPFNYMWEVPLTFTSSLEKNFTNDRIYWLRKTESSTSIPDSDVIPDSSDEHSWLIGNIRQNCYYRVNYDMQNWEALIHQLKTDHTVIDPINRAQIVDDAWSLASSGHLDQLTALRTIEYLSKEEEHMPFAVAVTRLNFVGDMLMRTGTYGMFQKYVIKVGRPLYDKLGWDNDDASHLESLLRSTVIRLSCYYGDEDCVAQATALFNRWMNNENNNPINPSLKSTVYCTAIANGGAEAWDFAYRMYKEANVAAEAERLLIAMGCAKETWILQRYLELALQPEEVRKQDAMTVVRAVARNVVGLGLAWDFTRANWEYLMEQFRAGAFSASRLVGGVTADFNTDFELEQLEEFIVKYPDLGPARTPIEQALERVRSNIKWMKSNQPIVAQWLEEQGTEEEIVTDVRLPLSVYPIHYDVELKPDIYGPDPTAFTFEGHVNVTVNCRESTNNVSIHVNKLDLAPFKVMGLDGCATPEILNEKEDKARQFMVITFTASLEVGCNYSLETNFTGPLKDDLAGLYLSSYKRGNESVYIATTQFQATDARKAFPCFDEPAVKATFSVTLLRKRQMVSLSNMPIERNETREDDYVADIYEKTPKMSTYLLAFIVCDFAHKEKKTQNGVTYRAWARREAINQVDYALDVGVQILDYFEEYFNVTYPLPKQDMIAIPDFGAGAMENWGLITYRETAMLYDPEVSAESNKQRVAVVVSHELAHQWFGNLVTPSWWDDLWLNEGFASYVEYMGVDIVEPTWKMFEQFVVEDLQSVFDFDSLASSHPVYVPVAHPAEISEIFDRISYAKKYLNRLKYDAAFHDDLWEALTEQSIEDSAVTGQPAWDVKTIMDTWTLQMNYPVVTLNRTGLPAGTVSVTQDRFLWDRNSPEDPRYPSPFGYRWEIPLTIASSMQPDFNTTDIIRINTTEDVITDTSLIPGGQSAGWIVGNAKQFGYYRVNYDAENWQSLINVLSTSHEVIDPINRGQIINDAWNLAKAGLLDMTVALDTTTYLAQEESYVPWVAATRELSFVDLMLWKNPVYGAFSNFVTDLVEEPYLRIGWANTSDHLTAYVRSIVFSQACGYGIAACVSNATDLYRQWMSDPTGKPVDPDLKSFVYCTAIREGGREEWDFAYEQYKQSDVASEKSRLLSAMACASTPWILEKYLNLALDPNEIRRQDATNTISYIARNPIGRLLAWDFFTSKWDVLLESYGGSSFSFSRVIGAVTQSFNTVEQLEKLEQFMASHPNQGSGARAFKQAVEKTQGNIRWMEKNYDVIKMWLHDKGYRS